MQRDTAAGERLRPVRWAGRGNTGVQVVSTTRTNGLSTPVTTRTYRLRKTLPCLRPVRGRGGSSSTAATRSSTSGASPTARSRPTRRDASTRRRDGRRRATSRRWRRRHQRRPHLHRAARAGCSTSRAQHGLRVMVGLPWEQHVAFLDDPARARLDRARGARRRRARCAGHPAVLCYAVGNEIPAPIVRWHGRTRDRALPRAALPRRQATRTPTRSSPTSTTRRPSTCELPFLDFLCFNVYLEQPRASSRRYLARLQNLAGDRPLLLAESASTAAATARTAQARVARLAARARRSTAAAPARSSSPGPTSGTAAATTIDDWDFGLTDRDARAQAGARRRARRLRRGAVRAPGRLAARSRVVVCTYNGARDDRASASTALRALDYPDYEVIVVDDGSTDGPPRSPRESRRPRDRDREPRAQRRPQHRAGSAAPGEIVAYIDDDACPDPRLAAATSSHAFATSDARRRSAARTSRRRRRRRRRVRRERARRADPRPGLRHARPSTSPAATWRSAAQALEAIGGFDPQFRAAGDDVDICWRLQDAGGTIGFSPRRRRLAPPPRLGARLLAPAARLRQGRGAARAQVAGEVQRARPRHLARPALRHGVRAACGCAAGASTTAAGARRSSSRSTDRAGLLGVAAADARVVCSCSALLAVLWPLGLVLDAAPARACPAPARRSRPRLIEAA